MTTGPLQVRRDTTAANDLVTPAAGEPLLNTDEGKELRVGDNILAGGQYAMGTRNRRRVLSQPTALPQRSPTVTRLFDVGWWEDPDASAGTGFTTKQGYSLTPGAVSDPWECFAKGRVPAGAFVGGSWIDIKLTFTVETWDAAKQLVAVPGVVWDFDGTQTPQSTMDSGNYAVSCRHDTGVTGEVDWEDQYLASYWFRLTAQGYTEHWGEILRARVYDEGGATGTGFAPVFTSGNEGKCFRNTLDMSVDHDLYAGAIWLDDSGTSTVTNDIRVRSASAYLYGFTGGVATDLAGATS